MRIILGLVFIAIASSLALSGAQSLSFASGQSAAYFAGQLFGAFFIPAVLGFVGMKWIRPAGDASSAALPS